MNNVEQLLMRLTSQVEHELEQKSKGYKDWVLQKEANVYGRIIPAGTVFVQMNGDYYHPIINGARCPSYQVDFYIVKNNPEYFSEQINISDGCFTEVDDQTYLQSCHWSC
ncbi:hypothetical protein [Larkinella ripae]